MIKAKYFRQLKNDEVRCLLCPHYCLLKPGETGRCRARQNQQGILYSINYAKTVTISMDPMEKKPLYHYHPGEMILSIGSNSCNLSCDFCQNYTISQFDVPVKELNPEQLLELCDQNRINFVAFTYTEPITWFEYVLDAAKILQDNKIGTVMVTNGFINQEPLKELLPFINAMNIDLKSMDDDFYQRLCGARLQPVLDTIRYSSGKCCLEITNLLIPGENDSESQIQALVDFIQDVDDQLPLHFSKYYPQYKMTNQPTPDATLYEAKKIAEKKLKYVYLGNILTDNNTYCPKCKKLLISRENRIRNYLNENRCPDCNTIIPIEF